MRAVQRASRPATRPWRPLPRRSRPAPPPACREKSARCPRSAASRAPGSAPRLPVRATPPPRLRDRLSLRPRSGCSRARAPVRSCHARARPARRAAPASREPAHSGASPETPQPGDPPSGTPPAAPSRCRRRATDRSRRRSGRAGARAPSRPTAVYRPGVSRRRESAAWRFSSGRLPPSSRTGLPPPDSTPGAGMP